MSLLADDLQAGTPWHALPVDECLDRLRSARGGLTRVEAGRRLAEHGPNELRGARRASPWALLLGQFRNVLVVILLIAAALSVALGHGVEAIAIAVIVLFAALLGFAQEYRAERGMEALREMAAPTATVVRDGEELEVPARDVVPGDVILLYAGDRIPADARLIEAVNLRAEEAPLTGESTPVEKGDEPTPDGRASTSIGDRAGMVHAGTAVTYGRGRAVVAATGMDTEFGKVARMLQRVEPGPTPLQENLARLGRALARAAFGVVAVIVALGLLRGQPLVEMLVFGIALAVAVVPEALPAVVTISLAIGVQRMLRRNALIRRLPAVETLGSTSVIGSDKTGTLTRDEMTARRIAVAGRVIDVSGSGYEPVGAFSHRGREVAAPGALGRLLRAATLASDAHVSRREGTDRWVVKGDPTEGALVVAAAKAGLHKADLDERYPRVGEVPFTSETRRMITLHETPGGLLACAKGAPESLLGSCRLVATDDGEEPLGPEGRAAILEEARRMAAEALRVLAVADRRGATLEDAESDMTFLGLVGMIDPPRPEARPAIERCREAGIKVVMITGDHPLTAAAVARELGILRGGRVITGAELEAMGDEELARRVEGIEVYARVSPADKLRVVKALQARGHVVAMTGDGVNDAPALKRAEIGVAMGVTGTDVTKEAAAMTLTDDNFASIVAAVEEGRGVFNNVKKYLMYLLSSNFGEIGLMAGAALLGLPLPLSAVMLLYVNLASDGLPALALAVDPPEPDLMRHPPRDPRTGLFTRPVVVLMAVGAAWSAFVNLGVFAWAIRAGRPLAGGMTLTFATLVLTEFFKAFNFRSDRRSVLAQPFANGWLDLAIAWELALLAFVIEAPFLRGPFGTAPLGAGDWLLAVAAASSVTPVLEVAKWLERRGWFGRLD
ncbi:Calcium-transporting ATPase 1 [Aquisphaera giovannonii]|uniref:Calcium-transporting ATPase 1 n=1 Tax=Aquisphaera giovannonii TaxID=406548 RepID=A0A5B9WEA1_9BACT|nr:cation-translocating P-type ATPase [Aquisphaera giovannonii]QEH38988.1 Calcium-transporting ATPase 1 [Aquisphaera giovannonii]